MTSIALPFVLIIAVTCEGTAKLSTGETNVAPAAPTIAVAASDWPWWRGLAGDGRSRDRAVLKKWSETKNVTWRAAVPGRGHSSPIVCGERVFLTTADEDAQKQLVMAFDRATGRESWSTVVHEGGFMPKHGKNSHASATPACDGERVFSVFINGDRLHVTATDLDGKIAWQTPVGPFGSEHGYGSSPVLYKSLVLVLGDNLTKSFIAALDRNTGKIVWQTERPTTGRHGSYATPIVATVSGDPQLLVSGMGVVTSYDPATGDLLWWSNGPAEVTACTMAFSDKLVFASGGFPEKELLAIRADGFGDVSGSHVAWRSAKGVTYVPSPLYHDGLLYVVSDGNVTTCFDAATGGTVWQGRLDGNFSSSPVLAGDHLFVTNEAGKTFVLKAGRKFEIVAQNDLGDGGFATPAISRGQIFIRTNHALYCVGMPAARGSKSD
jgi:hypothetical protein